MQITLDRFFQVFKQLWHVTKLKFRIISQLSEESGREWNSGNYPHLHTPMSASVVLQWALR